MNLRLAFTVFATLSTVVFAELDQSLDEVHENIVDQQTDVAPNNLMIGALEDVRFQMPCGWPDRGIPPLVPLHIEHLEQYVGAQGIIDLQFLLDRVRIRNLDEFIVKRFDLNVLTMRLHFEFTYNRIKVLADNYYANGRIVSTPIVGRSGYFEMDFFDVDIVGHSQLGTRNLIYLNMQTFVAQVSVGRARANIEMLGGRFTNQLLNILLENQIPRIVDDNAEAITNAISATVVPAANEELNTMTLLDLVNLINGGGGGGGSGAGEDGKCVPQPN